MFIYLLIYLIIYCIANIIVVVVIIIIIIIVIYWSGRGGIFLAVPMLQLLALIHSFVLMRRTPVFWRDGLCSEPLPVNWL